MLGLDAIIANNGWVMALAGALIVMSGLAVLSFIISKLHRIVMLFEKKDVSPKMVQENAPTKSTEKDILHDLTAAAERYRPLCADLGETFELIKLYEVFNKENLPHPHITIRSFREAGILAPIGEGSFSWKNI